MSIYIQQRGPWAQFSKFFKVANDGTDVVMFSTGLDPRQAIFKGFVLDQDRTTAKRGYAAGHGTGTVS